MNDDELLARLATVLRDDDGVPDAVVAGARAAIGLRSLDADLAALEFDSWLAPPELAGMRWQGGERHRQLSFTTATATVRVDVELDVHDRVLVGQVAPPGPSTVELRQPGGCTTTVADGDGRFRLVGLAEGPSSLRVSSPDGHVVTTEWLPL